MEWILIGGFIFILGAIWGGVDYLGKIHYTLLEIKSDVSFLENKIGDIKDDTFQIVMNTEEPSDDLLPDEFPGY